MRKGPLLGAMAKAWAVQRENMGSSLKINHFMQKSQRLSLYPVRLFQHHVIMEPALGNGLFFSGHESVHLIR